MNKIIFLLAYLLTITTSWSQEQKEYSIAINENTTTTLIFKDGISTATVGHSDYTMVFNKKESSPVGLLRGVKGPDSNLMVITENGNLYNFKVKYSKTPTKTTHFIEESLAEGNIYGNIVYSELIKAEKEKALQEQKAALRRSEPLMLNDPSGEVTVILDKEVPEESESYIEDKTEYMRKFSSNLVSKRDFYLRKFSSQNGLYFHLKNLVYNKNELYFVFKIDNESGLDYDVREVEISMVSKDENKSTSNQELELKPMMIYNQPSRVEGHRKKTFVYVFDKFSIGDKKSINCTLIEDKGERNITIVLDENTINNPNGS